MRHDATSLLLTESVFGKQTFENYVHTDTVKFQCANLDVNGHGQLHKRQTAAGCAQSCALSAKKTELFYSGELPVSHMSAHH
jgi:hypothetical protein